MAVTVPLEAITGDKGTVVTGTTEATILPRGIVLAVIPGEALGGGSRRYCGAGQAAQSVGYQAQVGHSAKDAGQRVGAGFGHRTQPGERCD